jgi:uncharacterized protein YacL
MKLIFGTLRNMHCKYRGDKMIRKVKKVVVGIAGIILGLSVSTTIQVLGLDIMSNSGLMGLSIQIGFPLLIGIIFYLFSYKVIGWCKRVIKIIENELEKIPFHQLILGSIGLVTGLYIANLLSKPLNSIGFQYVEFAMQVILYGLSGFFGILIFSRRKDDIIYAIENVSFNVKTSKDELKVSSNSSCPKILDTTTIIDGRIADICKAGFIEGPLIISKYVLSELQNIADSPDHLRRNRGRRGLDILNQIQKELDVEIIINEESFEDVEEVDSKILRLTQLLKGRLITNDYNLSKVAEVQGIEVLSISELANAIKPVVLPGEEMTTFIVKDGKEHNQGLGYLGDGTMIVVELGRKYIGETISVVVESVLQTAAGKIIFAKPKAIADRAVQA